MNKPKFYITDVFTLKKYGGNPLATFIDCESLSDDQMQSIAKEINFSETTFITSRKSIDGGFDVRIFTPNEEVEFAGHPTLGTAYVIKETLNLTTESSVTLNLKIGKISVTFDDHGEGNSLLWMKQVPPTFGSRLSATEFANMLGVKESDIDSRFPIEEVSTGFPTLIVPLANMEALKQIRIQKDAYISWTKESWSKVILAFCQSGYEKHQKLSARVFADYFGIPEDAATGSSNGSLAAYLATHRVLGDSNIEVNVGQGYEMGRPSTLSLRAKSSQQHVDVYVGGGVVEVAEGTWT